ncbi:MAG: 16S rRNA (guanine(966)-N(2))-methyltransferase RsmD [Gallicola sp.]|nr:16S rRNA (guanine(966)-N(2))-methyltransferase RsmD [Gallicola sp.]
MRVISGEKKGRKLFSPSESTRPTEDRVKEALFNILTEIEEGAAVLDLFAGSGGVGIEFLSRGAGCAVFSEYNRENIHGIKKNLDHVGYEEKGIIYSGDFKRNLYQISQSMNSSFDYIFIDPPYDRKDYYFEALEGIHNLSLLKKDGIIILESREELNLDLDFFECIKEKKYGKRIRLYFLRRRD